MQLLEPTLLTRGGIKTSLACFNLGLDAAMMTEDNSVRVVRSDGLSATPTLCGALEVNYLCQGDDGSQIAATINEAFDNAICKSWCESIITVSSEFTLPQKIFAERDRLYRSASI